MPARSHSLLRRRDIFLLFRSRMAAVFFFDRGWSGGFSRTTTGTNSSGRWGKIWRLSFFFLPDQSSSHRQLDFSPVPIKSTVVEKSRTRDRRGRKQERWGIRLFPCSEIIFLSPDLGILTGGDTQLSLPLRPNAGWIEIKHENLEQRRKLFFPGSTSG
ncbi:hypothetical protein KSP40_PGU009738 [Platanthera guangdongensis]|uniref:Ribosomal protein L2 n=1 Tax=Platanthera guangdongensis TaxID=2320717 RepID=A0ABR2MP35_9ASPA